MPTRPRPTRSGPHFSTDPPPAVLPPGIYLIVGPEFATCSVVQPIARQMGFTMLDALYERIGDTLMVENAGADAEGAAAPAGPVSFGQQIDNRYQSLADPLTRMFAGSMFL